MEVAIVGWEKLCSREKGWGESHRRGNALIAKGSAILLPDIFSILGHLLSCNARSQIDSDTDLQLHLKSSRVLFPPPPNTDLSGMLAGEDEKGPFGPLLAGEVSLSFFRDFGFGSHFRQFEAGCLCGSFVQINFVKDVKQQRKKFEIVEDTRGLSLQKVLQCWVRGSPGYNSSYCPLEDPQQQSPRDQG